MSKVFSGICLGLWCGVLSAAPAGAAQNLLVNPGFEANGGSYDGWTTFAQNGVQLSSASGDSIVHSGLEASKIFGEFTGCDIPIPQFDVTLYLQSFTPTPGLDYEFSGFSYVSSADIIPGITTCSSNRCIAKLTFFDAAVGGSEISSNEIVIGDWSSPLDQWNEFSVTAPAPAGAQRLEALILFLQPGCDGGSVFIDDLSLTANTPPPPLGENLIVNPSFDLNPATNGWTVFGNTVWENRGQTIPQFAFARRTPPGAAKMWSSFTIGEDSGMYQGFPAAAGSVWELKVYALNSCQEDPIDGTSDNYVSAKITFLDGSLPPVEIAAAETVLVDASTPPGQWTQSRLVAEAPVGTQTVRAYLLFISPSLLGGDAVFLDDVSFRQTTATDVAAAASLPGSELRQNVPNPFSSATRIDFVLPTADRVDVTIYDVAGRRVTTLVDRRLEAGAHSVLWDGRLANGRPAASGVYQYVLRTSTGRTARSMMRIQ